MSFKIEVDKEACIGCGACAALCAENFEMDNEGKSKVKKEEVEELGCNHQAANSCPVNAIHIINEKGEKII